MNSDKIRQKFTKYFTEQKHVTVPSSSLLPHDDTSVLLTTAGMQQFKPYFLNEKDPLIDYKARRLVSIQKCFRTSDIEGIGDATHCTFFEMLGNFSIGDYFKNEAVYFAWEFITKELKINKKQLWATYFAGDDILTKDLETYKIWQKYLPREKIICFGREDNWWGPPGKTGPCGPCSEIHFDFTGQPCEKKQKCLPNCKCGRFMELWNLVFMEYRMKDTGKFVRLPTKNIDTGMSLERLAIILQNKKSVFQTDLFRDLIFIIEKDHNFGTLSQIEDSIRSRIIADHLKGSVFLLADGIYFSNKEQGYILRRIFRRALDQFQFTKFEVTPIIDVIINIYKSQYPILIKRREEILTSINKELHLYKKISSISFEDIINKINKIKSQSNALQKPQGSSRNLTSDQAFHLFSTYGLSPERLKREGFIFDTLEYNKKLVSHQKISRAGAQKKFGGHGLNNNSINEEGRLVMTKYHTATHLLHQALRVILGNQVRQRGSDINLERLRFDFEYSAKLTNEQIIKIEKLVNRKIEERLPVIKTEMDYTDALKNGALAFFKEKYPPKVTVYQIGSFSNEICGGPHVNNTNELGIFKIISEKSSSAGIRRIKAILT